MVWSCHLRTKSVRFWYYRETLSFIHGCGLQLTSLRCRILTFQIYQMSPRAFFHCFYIYNLSLYSSFPLFLKINWYKSSHFKQKKWPKPVYNKPKYILRQYNIRGLWMNVVSRLIKYNDSTLKCRLGSLVRCIVNFLWNYVSFKCSILQMFKIWKSSEVWS